MRTAAMTTRGQRGHELRVHEGRVGLLEDLALLLGCRETYGATLPDGRRPDVVRMDTGKGILFLGEAKNTETPGSQATRGRLLHYLLWIAAHIADPERTAILAICLKGSSSLRAWNEAVETICREVGLDHFITGSECFLSPHAFLWFIFRTGRGSMIRREEEDL